MSDTSIGLAEARRHPLYRAVQDVREAYSCLSRAGDYGLTPEDMAQLRTIQTQIDELEVKITNHWRTVSGLAASPSTKD